MKTIIPFKVLRIDESSFHLLIKVKVNNKVARLIIDTGASRSCFDLKEIKKFLEIKKLQTHDNLSSELGTNTMKSHSLILKKLQLGEIVIKNYEAVVIDMVHVNQSYNSIGLRAIDGVLGSDIMMLYNAEISYKKQQILLSQIKKTT